MKHILIIEDNQELQELYQKAFTAAGWTTQVAKDVDEGKFQLDDNKPDVIILDIMLPGGKNGFDLLEFLKKNEETKPIPVVIVTNLDSEEKVAREIGAADYIVKANASMDEIVNRVQKIAV